MARVSKEFVALGMTKAEYLEMEALAGKEQAETLGFTVTLEWHLGEDNVEAKLPVSAIEERGGGKVNRIQLLPYMAALITALYAVIVLARLTRGGDPMRAYIHEQTAQKLPALTRVCALFAVLAAAGQGSAVFANGAQMLLGTHGIFILLEIFSAAAFAAAAAFSRRMRWEKE